MTNEYSKADGEAGVAGLDLRTVWNVDESPAYDVNRTGLVPDCLVAIRTHRGLGRVLLRDAAIDLEPGTLVLVRNQSIARYHCAARTWAFWWFEFTSAGPLPCTIDEVAHTAVNRAAEKASVADIMSALRSPNPVRRMHASAGLSWLLTRWLAGRTDEPAHPVPHREAIERVVEEMHRRMGDDWSIPQMAANAGMSERLFRSAFARATGRSPKSFYTRLRLNAAMEHLRHGQANVKEVADRLGFSSPFHLSRTFRERFGFPPSSVLRQNKGAGQRR